MTTTPENASPPMIARAIGKYAGPPPPTPPPPTCASPMASGNIASSVVRVVIRMGRKRSRPAWMMAALRYMPLARRLFMCATSTMPMFTTTPIRIMIPIIAMNVNVVPVMNKNQ